jgi:hypothetical protein
MFALYKWKVAVRTEERYSHDFEEKRDCSIRVCINVYNSSFANSADFSIELFDSDPKTREYGYL